MSKEFPTVSLDLTQNCDDRHLVDVMLFGKSYDMGNSQVVIIAVYSQTDCSGHAH